MRGVLRVLALAPAVGLGACANSVVSLQNLEDLHREAPRASEAAVEPGPLEPLIMIRTIEDRGRCHRLWNRMRGWVFLDPNVESRDIDDPIKFSLYQLDVVRTQRDALEDWERWSAMLLLSELARRSPSRAVRAESFRALGDFCEDEDFPSAGWAVRELPTDAEEDRVAAAVSALGKVATADDAQVQRMLRQESAALRDAAEVLAAARSPRVGTTERIARLAVILGPRVGEGALASSLDRVARVQTARTVYQSAVLACEVVVPDVQSEAIRLCFRLDPEGASEQLATLMQLQLGVPEVQVALLQTLAEVRPDPTLLYAPFRDRLGDRLDSIGQAGVVHWSREALAGMLGLDPELSIPELAARWEALGGVEGPTGSGTRGP